METYIIWSPHGGDVADGDDVMYNRSFNLLRSVTFALSDANIGSCM